MIPLTDAAAFAERVPQAILTESDPFLPELKELKTKVTCLGYWSRLFEDHRSSLDKLRLNCSHIGLPSVCGIKWSDGPNLWPNLKVGLLGIKRSNGGIVTVNTLKSIALQLNKFHHLEELIVPALVRTTTEGIVLSTLDVLAGHALPAGLQFLL